MSLPAVLAICGLFVILGILVVSAIEWRQKRTKYRGVFKKTKDESHD